MKTPGWCVLFFIVVIETVLLPLVFTRGKQYLMMYDDTDPQEGYSLCGACGRSNFDPKNLGCGACVEKRSAVLLLCAQKYDVSCTIFGFPIDMLQCILVRLIDGLYHAASMGNIANMRFHLSRGIPLTYQTMCTSVTNGRIESVRFLVENGLRGCIGKGLNCAVWNHRDDIFDYLIEKRTLLKEEGWVIMPLLFTAVYTGRLDILKRLMLEPDADIHCREDLIRGDTLLHAAMRATDCHWSVDGYPIMVWLVENGIDPWVKDNRGKNIDQICSHYYWSLPAEWVGYTQDSENSDDEWVGYN